MKLELDKLTATLHSTSIRTESKELQNQQLQSMFKGLFFKK